MGTEDSQQSSKDQRQASAWIRHTRLPSTGLGTRNVPALTAALTPRAESGLGLGMGLGMGMGIVRSQFQSPVAKTHTNIGEPLDSPEPGHSRNVNRLSGSEAVGGFTTTKQTHILADDYARCAKELGINKDVKQSASRGRADGQDPAVPVWSLLSSIEHNPPNETTTLQLLSRQEESSALSREYNKPPLAPQQELAQSGSCPRNCLSSLLSPPQKDNVLVCETYENEGQDLNVFSMVESATFSKEHAEPPLDTNDPTIPLDTHEHSTQGASQEEAPSHLESKPESDPILELKLEQDVQNEEGKGHPALRFVAAVKLVCVLQLPCYRRDLLSVQVAYRALARPPSRKTHNSLISSSLLHINPNRDPRHSHLPTLITPSDERGHGDIQATRSLHAAVLAQSLVKCCGRVARIHLRELRARLKPIRGLRLCAIRRIMCGHFAYFLKGCYAVGLTQLQVPAVLTTAFRVICSKRSRMLMEGWHAIRRFEQGVKLCAVTREESDRFLLQIHAIHILMQAMKNKVATVIKHCLSVKNSTRQARSGMIIIKGIAARVFSKHLGHLRVFSKAINPGQSHKLKQPAETARISPLNGARLKSETMTRQRQQTKERLRRLVSVYQLKRYQWSFAHWRSLTKCMKTLKMQGLQRLSRWCTSKIKTISATLFHAHIINMAVGGTKKVKVVKLMKALESVMSVDKILRRAFRKWRRLRERSVATLLLQISDLLRKQN
jgi:hypothetical protein